MFSKLLLLKISQNSEEIPMLDSPFSKVTGLQLGTLLKQRLPLGCIPVNFAKFLKNTFFTEYLQPAAFEICL